MKTLTLLAAFLIPSSLQAEDKKPAAKDDDKIQGTWQMVSGEKGGNPAPDKFVQAFRLTFKAGWKITAQSKGEEKDGTYKIDSSKKPRQIEISIDGKTLEGIYELDGDGLKLCLSEGGARPAEFKSPEGSKTMLMVLKRQKK